ncbi:MAG TPA: amino acid racemase [Opitutaceae bacterium]
MKCIGLIGGIGWEATALYYRILNQEVRNRYGSLHSARLFVNSLEFQSLDLLVRENRWNDAGALLADAARRLEAAGVDAVVLCSNLMHYVVEHIEAAVRVPVLHVGDAVLGEARAARVSRLGVLGTRFTLEHDFLFARPAAPRGRRPGPIDVITPVPGDLEELDRIIYSELCQGVIRDESRTVLLRMARELRNRGAQAIVLGSSELALLLGPADFTQPLFDSTELHALAVARWAMGEANPWRIGKRDEGASRSLPA